MSDAISLLEEIRHLMELKGENPFKIRAYDKAIHELSGREDLLERAKAGTLTHLDGVGKGISEVLTEYLVQGHSALRDELRAAVPAALVELTEVPGLGPKKARHLIDELGIESVQELEYACRENRLLKLSGFGPKIQQKILEGIQFRNSNQGRQRLVDALPIAERFLKELTIVAAGKRVSETGALRRRMEILSGLEFLIEEPVAKDRIANGLAKIRGTHGKVLPVELYYAPGDRFGYELARTTASPEHWKALGNPAPFDARDEEVFFKELGLNWIPPEARETGEEVSLARSGALADLLPWNGVQGIFHNHTTRSDGGATLEQMVIEAKRQGFKYIGISDHSQSAFYAQGLKPEALEDQRAEIEEAQARHPEIRIFWGIESDILADGSLDYDPSILKKFDFVIASIHSRFKMDRETMTQRILQAVRNPYTRFIGHLTGRLLLGRKGYDLDIEKIIREASARGVAIEINAHPARLDIDWRWGGALRANKTFVSINPDAHDTAGIQDTRYGIAMARKALLPSAQVINSRSVKEIEQWLKRA